MSREQDLIQEAQKKYEQGKYEEALALFDEAIKENPKNAENYYKKGTIKALLREYNSAIISFDKATQINPNNAKAHYNKGLSHTYLGQYKKALKEFIQATHLEPDKAEFHNNRGATESLLEEYLKSILSFNIAIKIYSNSLKDTQDKIISNNLKKYLAEAHYNRGRSYSYLEKYEEAKKDFDKAIEINPNYAEAYSSRGTSEARLKKYENALNEFNKAIQINPDFAEAYRNRANVKDILGDKEGARLDRETAEKIKRRQNLTEEIEVSSYQKIFKERKEEEKKNLKNWKNYSIVFFIALFVLFLIILFVPFCSCSELKESYFCKDTDKVFSYGQQFLLFIAFVFGFCLRQYAVTLKMIRTYEFKMAMISYQETAIKESKNDELKKEVILKTTEAITKDIYNSGKKETILSNNKFPNLNPK